MLISNKPTMNSDEIINYCYKVALDRPATKEEHDDLLVEQLNSISSELLLKNLKGTQEYEEKIRNIIFERSFNDDDNLNEDISFYKKLLKIKENHKVSKLLSSIKRNSANVFNHSDESLEYEKSCLKSYEKIEKAQSLDELIKVHWSYTPEKWREISDYLYNMLRIKSYDYLFDAGFGSGANARYFLEKNRTLKMAGCDFYRQYVSKAERLELLSKNIWFHASTEDILSSFPDSIFDATYSIGITPYQNNPELNIKLVSDMIRITKAGGRIFIGTIQDPDDLPEGWIKKKGYTGYIDRFVLPDIVKKQNAKIVAIGTEREMLQAEGHQYTDQRYSVLIEKL